MARSRGLTAKHLKALELLGNKEMSITNVAKACGFSRDHLYDLISGNERAGAIAGEFKEKIQATLKEIEERTALKTKQLNESAITKLKEWVDSLKDGRTLTGMERRTMIEMVNAMNRGKSTYNIGSVSYSKGLTGEDLLNEFRRLNALAQSALERKPVSGTTKGAARLLSASSRVGDQAEEV